MKISSKSSLDGSDDLAISLAGDHAIGHVMIGVAPVVAALLEAQNKSMQTP